jgi:hypothetical protein
MSTTLKASTHTETLVDAVDNLAAKAARIEAASRARGWGFSEGESAVYRGGSTIDEILDLRNIAQAGCLDGSLSVCERFLTDIAGRPGIVTCEEIQRFCAEVRIIATS